MAKITVKRLASQIRLIVSDALQNRLSDPRLERLASVTRIEVSADLSFADVYISVMGTDRQQGTYMKALDHAHGHVQSLVARKLRTRTCPTVRFHLDQSIKKGIETIRLIDQAMSQMSHPRDSGPRGDASDREPNDADPKAHDDSEAAT